jgi:sigma-B regulation protein RsbU (phosphoserine phosphatase)
VNSTLSPAWPQAPELDFDPAEEARRLEDLLTLKLVDPTPEARFDRITRLAAEFFGVAVAYVAFMDDQKQWLKSSVGICPSETDRNMTFCQYTIHHGKPMIIPDARLHPVGCKHPLVVGEPFIRFYAGVPLSGPNGRKLGTFCLVDFIPREFGEKQLEALTAFASLVEREINLGEIIQTQNDLLETRRKLVETQKKLDHEFSDAVKYVRKMLPPPMEGDGETLDWQFHPSARLGGDGLGYRRIDDDRIAVYILDVTGHGLGSTLLAVTALELLRSPVARIDYSRPSEVIERLNATFQMKDHAGKFISVWYGVYSRTTRCITYANAGHPPPLILGLDNGVLKLQRTEAGTSVLGVLPELQIAETTAPFPIGAELFLFTDGLYELMDEQGQRGSYDEFHAHLQDELRSNVDPWKAMLQWFQEARGNRAIDDDVSLLRLAT